MPVTLAVAMGKEGYNLRDDAGTVADFFKGLASAYGQPLSQPSPHGAERRET